MAQITARYPFVRHLRSEPIVHTLQFRKGRLVREGNGLAFFFRPTTTGVAEVPVDDRDATFTFRARTADFQQVAVQGVLTYRVVDAGRLAQRVDFTIDLRDGTWRGEPLDQMAGLLTQLAQQLTLDLIANMDLRGAVRDGIDQIRRTIQDGLVGDQRLADLGVELVAVRVQAVRPDAEMEQALQTPIQEAIQQQADEARFNRRAMAVDKERAIAENEMANRLELTRREEDLIAQQGANHRREVQDMAAAEELEIRARLERETLEATARREVERLAADAEAERRRVLAAATAEETTTTADARATATRATGAADAEAEGAMMATYADIPLQVMLGLAARELAGNLERIDHLNLAPDTIGPMLTTLMAATTRQIEAREQDA